MEFKQLVVERYASRKYTARKVEDEKMRQLREIVRLTPSTFNLQPWKIKVIDDGKLKDQLASLAFGGDAQVATCSHLLVLCANTELDSLIDKNVEGMKKAHVPEEFIIRYQTDLQDMLCHAFYGQKWLVESQKNVYLMAASVVYGAKSLGIDSCIMQGFDAVGFSKVLDIPSRLVPTLLVTLGYSADRPMPKVRLPEGELFF